jgi:Ca-activated chloride channel family protein
MPFWRILLILALAAVVATTGLAQTPAPSPTPAGIGEDEVIKVTTQLVTIPVRVMDKSGRFIPGLKQPDFRILEDGKPQEIAYFLNEEEPFTVVLMLDMSYSTKFKLVDIQKAAIEFISQLRPQDKVAVVSFDAQVHVLAKPTTERDEITKAIRSTRIATGTSVYDAVDTVMNSLSRAVEGRKAVILFSDGVDTTSRSAGLARNLEDATELDALVYPIRYDTFADVQSMRTRPTNGIYVAPVLPKGVKPDPNRPDIVINASGEQGTTLEDYTRATGFMQALADRSGGRLYEATDLNGLSAAYARIAAELREFYSIGYYPTGERLVDRTSNVKVKVDRDGLVVRAREEFITRKKN